MTWFKAFTTSSKVYGFGARHLVERQTGRSVEELAEVVDGLRPVRLLTDDNIDPEPEHGAFVVVVDAATPVGPRGWRIVENLRGYRSIDERAPGAARFDVEVGGGVREIFAPLFRIEQTASRREHFSEVVSEPFVDPEQLALHGSVVGGRSESGGTAILSIPGVHVFVREQTTLPDGPGRS